VPSFKYPNHTIGQHIVPFQLFFHKDKTVQQVIAFIEKKIGSWPNTEEIYVVNEDNKLIGQIDFKDLVSTKHGTKLSEIMDKNFESLTDHSHQNTAIKLAINKGLESIPVTTKGGTFLGIIDSGQILKIMHEEHVEKLMHFSGILANESLVAGYKSKITSVVESRLPWLLLGLTGGALSTFLIRYYSSALETELALAFFIPVIVYMNAAVGTQAQIIFVRYSALEKVQFVKSLIFELKVASLIALTLSAFIFVFTAILIGINIATIVALSMFLGILSSAIIGTAIPFLLERSGKDPAIGSGPFTTIIQDLLSILIYFTIATALL
jgi:magnesium transporter